MRLRGRENDNAERAMREDTERVKEKETMRRNECVTV